MPICIGLDFQATTSSRSHTLYICNYKTHGEVLALVPSHAWYALIITIGSTMLVLHGRGISPLNLIEEFYKDLILCKLILFGLPIQTCCATWRTRFALNTFLSLARPALEKECALGSSEA
jgi:hypothetical protein